MKTLNQLLVATVAIVALNFSANAKAGEPFLSPRAQGNQIHVVPGNSSASDANLISFRPAGNVRGWEAAQSLQKTQGSNHDVNLISGPRLTLSPKDPRYQMAVKQLREARYQVMAT